VRSLNLIVKVKGKARHAEVVLEGRRRLEQLDELGEVFSLGPKHDRQRHEERKDFSDGELVANASEAVFDAWRVHQLLVLRALESCECVGDHAEHERRLVKLEAVSAIRTLLE
jgi:hypothetical protein